MAELSYTAVADDRDLILVQQLDQAIYGYFENGPKSRFEWSIEAYNVAGNLAKVGSWGANRWYMVKRGRTARETLGNLRRKLQAYCKRAGIGVTFEYAGR